MERVARLALAAIAIAVCVTGCGSAGPGAATAGPGSTTQAGPPTDGAGAGPSSETADQGSSSSSVDPGVLAQTRDQPGERSALFTSGSQALWQAIVTDDPAVAMPFFFPLSAYRQVKDVHDPAADWQDRLVTAFGRDVHRLHLELGPDATKARFVALDVPDSKATWVDPGQEHNKIGYWRVYGSSISFESAGTTRSMPIYSLISWRGEWYVVHVGPP